MNLRQVRKKIKSVTNVKKITKAMQLTSAVKMKKAQTVAIEGRPYREKLEELFFRILPSVNPEEQPLLSVKTESKKELIILISANKGLCGAFNMNLFRLLLKSKTDFKNTDFITLGKKGAVFVALMGGNNLADFSSNTPSEEVAAIFNMTLERYKKGEYAKVYLVYNKFISTLRNEAVKEELLPFELQVIQDEDKKEGKAEEKKEEKHDVEYVIEPEKKELFAQLLINYIEVKMRGAVQNSEASEHSARMIAMKNATDNATDVIYNYTMLRNKLRQQKITYELLDMVTATVSME